MLSLLFEDPATFFILVPVLLYSVIAHEVAHGWVASLFGDNTAKYSGRLSLNPLSHIDPVGTIALFIVGFGWAKPVPVNYSNLSNSRKAIIAISLAGIITNILIATIAIFLLQFKFLYTNYSFIKMLIIAARINIILGAFNLIPIPPLDGSRVVMQFLPYEIKTNFIRLEPYGFFIILFLLWTGLLSPIIEGVQNVILFIIETFLSLLRLTR